VQTATLTAALVVNLVRTGTGYERRWETLAESASVGKWKAAETLLRDAFRRGMPLDLTTGDPQPNDPADGGTWGQRRTVRADVIAALLVGAVPPDAGRLGVVRIKGARIAGRLDLSWARITYPLIADACYFEQGIDLTEAVAPGICVTRSWLPELEATALRTDGRLVLDGSHLQRVVLVGARIGGELSLQEAVITNPDGRSIDAEACQIGSRMLALGMRCEGEVRLIGGRIGGELDLDGAQLQNEGHRALNASRLTVDGTMFCSAGFHAIGQVRLPHTVISDQLVLRDATICHVPDDYAIQGEDLRAQALLLPTGDRITASINLMGAQIEVLDADPGHWPARVYLDGLSYAHLVPETPARDLLVWLKRDPRGFRARPYEQLASYYRSTGHDEDARRVLLASQRARYSSTATPLVTKTWGLLQEVTVGYGYRPWLAAIWLTALVTAGTLFFAAHPPPPANPVQHTSFDSLPYTIGLVIPLINTGQQNEWSPKGFSEVIAYLLIGLGWALATSLVAGITRILSRN
jgi:hypothetical protein